MAHQHVVLYVSHFGSVAKRGGSHKTAIIGFGFRGRPGRINRIEGLMLLLVYIVYTIYMARLTLKA